MDSFPLLLGYVLVGDDPLVQIKHPTGRSVAVARRSIAVVDYEGQRCGFRLPLQSCRYPKHDQLLGRAVTHQGHRPDATGNQVGLLAQQVVGGQELVALHQLPRHWLLQGQPLPCGRLDRSGSPFGVGDLAVVVAEGELIHVSAQVVLAYVVIDARDTTLQE